MLRSLDTLSGVAVSTVNASKDDMIADLKAVAPTLKALADAGTDLPDSLQVLLTYPFTDEVLRGVKGDYLNTYLSMVAVPAGPRVIPPLVSPGTPSPSASASATAQGGPDPAAEKRSSGRRGSASPLPLPSVSGAGATSGTASGGEHG
ncbi:MCE family protein OS=Streptomyces tendae OX=1932 GN=GUR47_10375 PE=4 SV=1 [Streptomyces tendae]